MEIVHSLLRLLRDEQKPYLESSLQNNNRAEAKLVLALLQGMDMDENAWAAYLKLNPSSLKKTQTLAKDLLFDFLKKSVETPFDEITVIQQLLLAGEIKTARKLYNALKKTYEQKQSWPLLDILYVEGYRLAQMTGDIDEITNVTKQRTKNAHRYYRVVEIYGKVMVEMLSVERFEKRGENPLDYLNRAEQLYQEAKQVGHHVVIHNALNTIYMIYARYFNEPEKTWQTIQLVNENRKRFAKAMNPLTKATTKITTINFLSIYEGFGNPEDLIADCEATIDLGGVLARVNFYYSLLGYYLTEERLDKVNHYLGLLKLVEDTTKFHQYKAIIMAIKAFIEDNEGQYQYWFKQFYDDPTHVDFPDMECMLRILELVTLYKPKSMMLYRSRLQALRVYMNRNLNKDRYIEEHSIINFLSHPEKDGNQQQLLALQNSYYRNVRFLVRHLLKRFAVGVHTETS